MFGIPRLENPLVEPFFHGLLQRMRSISSALEAIQSAMTSLGASSPEILSGQGEREKTGGEVRRCDLGLQYKYSNR